MKRSIMILLGCGALLVAGCGDKKESPSGPDPDDVTSIKIMTMAGGEGLQVGDMDIVKDDTLELYAAGFNEDGDYVKDVMAAWALENSEASIGTFEDSAGTAMRLVVSSYGKGTITATTDDNNSDRTGTLSAKPGAPAVIRSSMGNNSVNISWSPSSSGGIDGYFVYVVTDASPAESTTHTSSDTTLALTMITSGSPYYVYVVAFKTVTPLLPAYLSAKSEILHVAARPYFAVTDTMFAYAATGSSAVNGAFGWASDGTGEALTIIETNKDTMDFYVALVGGTDTYLLSPDGHLIGWQSNVRTWFYDMGTYAFDDAAVSDAPVFSEDTWTRAQKITAGHVYALKTAEGNYVKLCITTLNTVGTVPYFMFEYGYQTAPGVTLFKR